MKNQKIVLVGGCFDLLHPGHISFLEKAKEQGNFLIVLLESDLKIKKDKGEKRPIFSQKERAKMLKSLKVVDKVIGLPFMDKETEYDQLILKLSPQIIATTLGDPQIEFKKRSAKLVGAKVKIVTKLLKGYSTGEIIQKIKE
jgi:FAD synthetase